MDRIEKSGEKRQKAPGWLPQPMFYVDRDINFERLEDNHFVTKPNSFDDCVDCCVEHVQAVAARSYISDNQRNFADVLCGQGGGATTQPGNIAYRSAIMKKQALYGKADVNERTFIAHEIVDRVKKNGGRFLKRMSEKGKEEASSSQLWIEIDDKAAMDKTRQALREKTEDRGIVPVENPNGVVVVDDDVLLGRGGITNLHSK
jgi:prephenate dehydratase